MLLTMQVSLLTGFSINWQISPCPFSATSWSGLWSPAQQIPWILVLHFPNQACRKNMGGASSNAASRRYPAAPSDLPKSGGAAAPPPSDMPANKKLTYL